MQLAFLHLSYREVWCSAVDGSVALLAHVLTRESPYATFSAASSQRVLQLMSSAGIAPPLLGRRGCSAPGQGFGNVAEL